MNKSSVCFNIKRKPRPAQRLYVPPAQRNKLQHSQKTNEIQKEPTNDDIKDETKKKIDDEIRADGTSNELGNDLNDKSSNNCSNDKENENLVIMLNELRTGPDKDELEVDKEKEEMQRAIVNINRKSRPLIKHVQAKNDVLQINVNKNTSNKSNKKSPVKLAQVSNWEDLYLEDEPEDDYNESEYDEDADDESEEVQQIKNPKMQELEHVIEVYDFPSTFKSQDIMQIYSEVNKESMYIKWCDETHALLILGTGPQAQKALGLRHDIIKARPMTMAGAIAIQVAAKSDLRPAMKRPQTSMHTARRMITTALGAKNVISREVQEREREALRIAKEQKRTQRQNERDAWEGNPRPSTA